MKTIDYRQFLPLRSRVAVPAWADKEIAATLERFNAWKGDDVVIAFPAISDVHSSKYDFTEGFSFSDSKMHTLLAQLAGERAQADFVADLGDIDLDIGVPIDDKWPPTFRFCNPEECMHRVAVQQALYAECKLPVLFIVGNHDHSNGRFTNAMFGDAFNKTFSREKKIAYRLGTNGDFGWFDIPEKKFRAVFLNTSEEGYYGFSIEQIRFIVTALESLPDGWTVAVLQHFCTLTEIGSWVSFPDTKAARQEIVRRILEDFVASRAGEDGEIKWNFATEGKRELAGVFTGDSHFDHYARHNGVDYSITQGFGGIRNEDMPSGAYKTAPFKREEQTLIDFIAIKPARREVRIFRIGMGGAERDRGYTYTRH